MRETATEMSEIEAVYLQEKIEYQGWLQRSPGQIEEQSIIRDILRRHAGACHFGVGSYIARGAKVFTSHFSIGDDSYIAAGAIIRGSVTIGKHCTVNPYAHIAGTVRIGDNVRIAGLVSIYGFNHGFSRIDVPISAQPTTSEGIEIASDCWIGTNVVIVDGVKIGAHSVIAAGTIVISNFPEYSIIGGNPARLIGSRLTTKPDALLDKT